MSDQPIRKYGGPAIGQPRAKVKNLAELPKDFLAECLEYNPDTGVIIWKCRPVYHFPSAHAAAVWNANWARKEAGSKKCRKRSDHRSTIQICIGTSLPEDKWTVDDDGRIRKTKNILYSAHRLAFTLMGTNVPVDMVIDHINNDPWDNRWCNLRLVTQRENCRNRGASFGKTSGLPRNVFKTSNGKKPAYEARVSSGGFPTVEEALQWRNKMEILIFGKILHKEDK